MGMLQQIRSRQAVRHALQRSAIWQSYRHLHYFIIIATIIKENYGLRGKKERRGGRGCVSTTYYVIRGLAMLHYCRLFLKVTA